MVKLNVLAADIHKRMVEDDRFGYSWAERYGATTEKWTVDGVPVTVSVGDYDCSSSTITAWKLALKAAGYNNPLNGATYTGNMRSVFVGSGLFKWVPVNQAQRGDLYLNEANHVAMCQGNGLLSEFSSNEFGGAYGGVRGDQTGREAKINGYYSYPWDGCLHYVGTKEIATEKPEKVSATVQLYEANGTDAQKWHPDWNADGTVSLKSKSCGFYLDVAGASTKDGATVQAYKKNGTAAQKWKLVQLEGVYKPAGAAPFELIPAIAEGKRLDVKNGGKKNETPVQIWKANKTNAQRWVVLDDGTGWWQLVNVNSGKVLDVKGGGK